MISSLFKSLLLLDIHLGRFKHDLMILQILSRIEDSQGVDSRRQQIRDIKVDCDNRKQCDWVIYTLEVYEELSR